MQATIAVPAWVCHVSSPARPRCQDPTSGPAWKTSKQHMLPDSAVQVDADAHRSLGERYGVRGFPTIKYMPRGKAPTQENAEE
eukprot:365621-Chlamydomonas_euryale.AAC.10